VYSSMKSNSYVIVKSIRNLSNSALLTLAATLFYSYSFSYFFIFLTLFKFYVSIGLLSKLTGSLLKSESDTELNKIITLKSVKINNYVFTVCFLKGINI
jgi:hypothetical protein